MSKLLLGFFFCFGSLGADPIFGHIAIEGDENMVVVAVDALDIDGKTDGVFEHIFTFQIPPEHAVDPFVIAYTSFNGLLIVGTASAAIKMPDLRVGMEFFFDAGATDNIRIGENAGFEMVRLECYGITHYEVNWALDWVPPESTGIHEWFMNLPGDSSEPLTSSGGPGSWGCGVAGCNGDPPSCRQSCRSGYHACCFCSQLPNQARCLCIKESP